MGFLAELLENESGLRHKMRQRVKNLDTGKIVTVQDSEVIKRY